MGKILVMKEIAQILLTLMQALVIEFTVKVTDAYGATAIDTVSIKVNPEANECPEVYTEVYELIESEDEMLAENDDTEE